MALGRASSRAAVASSPVELHDAMSPAARRVATGRVVLVDVAGTLLVSAAAGAGVRRSESLQAPRTRMEASRMAARRMAGILACPENGTARARHGGCSTASWAAAT